MSVRWFELKYFVDDFSHSPRTRCHKKTTASGCLPWKVAVSCKPSSVQRERCGDHFSRATVAGSLRIRSTNDLIRARDPPHSRTTSSPTKGRRRSCLRLHAVGFAVPRPSPVERCALTAPFHPCRPRERGRRSVLCGTFPDLQPVVGGCYPPPCPVVLGLSSPPENRWSDHPSTKTV